MWMILKLAALVFAYLALFLGGVSLLGPTVDASAMTPDEQQLSLPMIAVVAMFDLAVIGAWVERARFGGWRLWVAAAVVMYGVKTFSSTLEAWYFVPFTQLPTSMLPGMFMMTIPVCLVWTGLVVWALGPRDSMTPALRLLETSWWRVVAAGTLLYPALFFGFGYYVAWQNPGVRAYYGGPDVPLPILTHFARMFAADPLVLPFEMLRGMLWVALGWPVIRGTRGPWWMGGLLYAAIMALVQNDVHLIPNPVMPAEVRFWHFIETASSNFVFAFGTAALFAPRALASARPAVQHPTHLAA